MIVEKVEKRSFKPRSARMLRAGWYYPAMPSCLRPAAFLTLFDPNYL
jgi:hypothetical protein